MRGYTIYKLHDLKHNIEVLRTSDDISFSTANLLQSNYIPIEAAIKKYEEEVNLLNERGINVKPENKEKQQAEYIQEMIALNSKLYEVDIKPVPTNLFTDIKGNKEVPQDKGYIKKFSYRDAYFQLLGEVITE